MRITPPHSKHSKQPHKLAAKTLTDASIQDFQKESTRNEDGTNQVASASLIAAGGIALSFVVGIFQNRIVAGLFGTSPQFDAYTSANIISELLVVALAGGTLVFAFLPVYTAILEKDRRDAANRLFSQVIISIVGLVGTLAIIVTLTAPLLVSAPGWGLGPGFAPEIQQLTAQLIRVLMLSTMIFSISNFITGTLHAHKHFLLPALSPTLYNIGIILGALFLTERLGIFGLAWGAVLGALLHLLIQLPGLFIYKVSWTFDFNFDNPALRRVAVLMAPRVADLFMARITIGWLNSNIASGFDAGSVSAIGFAFTLMNLPQTLIGTAIGFAIFPTLATLAAGKDVASQREALSGTLRVVLALVIPAAFGLVLLGKPIIQLLFEGGEFTAESTNLVYAALRAYTLYLVTQSILDMSIRAYAAQQDTYTPLYISFFTTVLNIGLAITLSRTALNYAALPLANGIAVGVEALIGLAILSRRWDGVNARQMLITTSKAIVASLVMSAVVVLFLRTAEPNALLSLAGGGLIGSVVYITISLLLGVREIVTIPVGLFKYTWGRFTG